MSTIPKYRTSCYYLGMRKLYIFASTLTVMSLILLLNSCNENFHITAQGNLEEDSFTARITGSNDSSEIGLNNAKIGVFGKFVDDTVYEDDGSNPSGRENEWIFKINNSEVGRIPSQSLMTSITNPGTNISSTHSELIVDDWVLFLDNISGGTAGTDLAIVDDVCVSSIVKDSDGNISSSSPGVCFNLPERQVYAFTGSDQNIIAPANASQAFVKAWGAAGGSFNANGVGGSGGYAEAMIPAQDLLVVVGEGGKNLSTTTTYGGGGAGGDVSEDSHSGGGLSGVFSNSFLQADAILIAGAGAGAGSGSGGSATSNGGGAGENGGNSAGPTFGGQAGTVLAGGSAGSPGTGGSAGSALQGGNGFVAGQAGGGGGSGFFGGGGGGASGGARDTGGGGGSNYALSGLSSVNLINGNTGASLNVPKVDPPNITDIDYDPAGIVGASFSTNTRADGGDGLVIIYWIP